MRLTLSKLPGLVLILAAATGCSDTTTDPGVPNGFWSVGDIWSGQVVITENTDAPLWPSDPVTIRTAEVRGDSLELAVNYGGGCREHSFLLLSDAAWMESNPVQVGVKLSHDAKGDFCDALLSRTLRFDLRPLRIAYDNAYQATSGTIRLNIRGFSSVLYSW